MGFFDDLRGAIFAGEFYHHILQRSGKNAWAFFMVLTAILAVIVAIFWSMQINAALSDGIAFFDEKIKNVEFVDGKIVNMPSFHEAIQYKNWTFYFDTLYVNEESFSGAVNPGQMPALFVGPTTSFIAQDNKIRAIPYPATFSQTIDSEYLSNNKSTFIIAVSIVCLIGAFLYKFISALLYIFLVITPVVLFKYRRMRMNFSSGFKTALYLAGFQLIASTMLDLAQISLPWSFIIYIMFYLFYIGAYVNIDLSAKASLKPMANT